MTWPSSDVPTTNMDAGTDNPQTARSNLLDLAQKFNQLRNHVTVFMQGLLSSVDAAAARTALGAASSSAVVALTGDQTVAGEKSFENTVRLVGPAALLGYDVGAGAVVTQTTSKTTTTPNITRPCGRIVTHNAALASGATAIFSVPNNLVTPDSIVVVNVSGSGSYWAGVQYVTDFGFAIRLSNTSGGTLSEAVTINFAVLSAAAS